MSRHEKLSSPRKTTGRPTQEQSTRLLQTIAQCALQAFMQYGYDGASIEGIARDARVSKRTVYRNFRDKQNLFVKATLHGMSKLNFQLGRSIDYSEDIESVLRRVAVQIYEVHSDPDVNSLIRMAIFEGGKNPARAEMEYRNADITLAPLIEYIGWLSTVDGWHIPDPKKAAIQLSALTTEGTRIFFEKAYNTKGKLERHATEVVSLLVRNWKASIKSQ